MIEQIVTAAGEITAALQNSDGTSNVYITSDPSVNALTLTLKNGLSNAVVFPPGTPVAYGDLPSGQSAVYLFLNGLIDNGDIANIALSATGWTAGTFTDSITGLQYLVIAPGSQVTLPPSGTLAFTLGNVLVQGSPRSGTADVDLAGATGVNSLQSDVSLFVNIANPPQPGKKKLDVEIGFDAPVTVYTGQAQSLTLHLVNKGKKPLVPDGTNAWGGVTPTFQLTLVYGNGAGALTTVAKAAQIGMVISNEYGNVWLPPDRRTQGKSPYWILQPDSDGGGTVLGTDENAAIQFAVSGIDATLPSGLDSALTVAYVSWHDVPGYDDGSTGVVITKKAGPRVTKFTADPASVPAGQSAIQTVLTWATAHATGVRFEAPQVNPAQTFWTSGSGPVEGGISVPRATTVTVIAYKDISADRLAEPGGAPGEGDDFITAKSSLFITGPQRTDLAIGLGSLGDIVIPAASTKAFIFQMNQGQTWLSQLTQMAVLDLSTGKVTGIVDLVSLIPSKGGGTLIDAAVPSPSGSVIHVLASSGDGASWLPVEYYILPLDVATASYGTPVPLGTVVPSGQPLVPSLFATPDGSTVYVSASDFKTNDTCVVALDAGSYSVKGSWTWQAQQNQQSLGPASPIASSPDGSVLLMSGIAGLATINVTGGFTVTSMLNIGQQLKMLFMDTPIVSADGTKAYCLAGDNITDPINGYLLTVDADLSTGALTLAGNLPLGLSSYLAGPGALAPDGKTLYLLTNVDVLTAFDTATYHAVPYYCGVNGQFTPLQIVSGSTPNVLYSTGNNQRTTAIVSVISLA